MLRKAFVLLGLAVLLSLLFPVRVLLADSGVDAFAQSLPVIDLAALCALAALLPAFYLFHDARLEQRIPRWNLWLVLLAVCSVLFVLLHMHWSLDLATGYARAALNAAPAVSHLAVVGGIEVAVRLGVLVSAVGVLMHLDHAPDPDAPRPRRRSKP